MIVQPKRRRPVPADGIVNTRFRVGVHNVTLSTSLVRRGTMAVWEPARPKEIPDAMKTQFLRGKKKHAQKLADISRNSITMEEEV